MRQFMQFFSKDRTLWLIVLWQLISVLLMSLGVWSEYVAWINLGLIAAYMLYVPPFYSLLLFVASLPFYVVLPNPYFDSMSMWRPLVVVLAGMWFIHLFKAQQIYSGKLSAIRKLFKLPELNTVGAIAERVDSRFMWWDKYLGIFILITFISLFVARFPAEGLKQIVFFLNAYIVYLVIINVVTTKDQVVSLIKYTAASLGVIVFLGYVQLVSTLFTTQYYFWQYWAIMVSKVYYGLGLSNVLAYSNSWFSYTNGAPTLRMFSIMPDSHSFGVIGVFLLCFLIPLTYYYVGPANSWKSITAFLSNRNHYVWAGIRFSGLAIIFSGTRGLWVGMIPAMLVSIALVVGNIVRPAMKKALIAFLLVILFFAISPLINQGLNLIRAGTLGEHFLDRAASIYDLEESSNAGRLVMWKDSLQYALRHPFGVGYGNFITSLVQDIPEGTSFEQAGDIKNLRYNLPQKFVTAHSLYLNILVELGLAGLLAFALFIFEIFLRAWKFLWENSNDSNLYIGYAAMYILTLIWILGYGLFDVTLFNDKVLLYFFISLALFGLIIRRYESFKQQEWVEGKHNG
jgi:O-antigen ligase